MQQYIPPVCRPPYCENGVSSHVTLSKTLPLCWASLKTPEIYLEFRFYLTYNSSSMYFRFGGRHFSKMASAVTLHFRKHLVNISDCFAKNRIYFGQRVLKLQRLINVCYNRHISTTWTESNFRFQPPYLLLPVGNGIMGITPSCSPGSFRKSRKGASLYL
mgnify:FL=1